MQESNRSDCGCSILGRNSRVSNIYEHLTMSDAPLAMAFVPFQTCEKTMEPCQGLQTGTIFPCLYKPFCGKGGACL